MKKYDIVIIGAGASGLVCASKLSDLNLNKNILLIDRMNKVGKKILATGNGRCNISNKNINLENYYSNNKNFVENQIQNLSNNIILEYFEELGLKTKLIENGYYPITEQSATVVEVLELKIKECKNIDILLETEVICIKKNDRFEIETNNEKIISEQVVLSTGGMAYPALGSNGSGYKLASSLNHKQTKIYEALTQVKSDSKSLKYLKGTRIKTNAKIYVNNKFVEEETGEVQFTETGLSGICIFNLSHIASYNTKVLKNNVIIKLDLMPDMNYEKLKKELENRKDKFKDRIIDFYLTGLLNNKISYAIYENLKINVNKKVSNLNQVEIENICSFIKEFEFEISGVNDFDNAQVTAGGVDTTEVNPKTFESLINKNLYIIGEIIDIHGDCGGYNLNFVFTSGLIAAESIGDYYDKNK